MSVQIDMNPFPLGAIAPTSGTPLSVLTNFALATTKAKELLFYAPKANTGAVYVGRSTMIRATYVGVALVLQPGERVSLPSDDTGGNILDLNVFYIDVDTTGDKALALAFFE